LPLSDSERGGERRERGEVESNFKYYGHQWKKLKTAAKLEIYAEIAMNVEDKSHGDEKFTKLIESFMNSLENMPDEYREHGVTSKKYQEMIVSAYIPIMKDMLVLAKEDLANKFVKENTKDFKEETFSKYPEKKAWVIEKHKRFYKNLTKLMDENGITSQTQLAELTGIHQPQISRIFSRLDDETYLPTFNTRKKIAEAFSLSVEDI